MKVFLSVSLLLVMSINLINCVKIDGTLWESSNIYDTTFNKGIKDAKIISDTLLNIFDTLELSITYSVLDSQVLPKSFIWGGFISDTTQSGKYLLSTDSVGPINIFATIEDNVGQLYKTDTIVISVFSSPPVITPKEDTVVSQYDDVTVAVTAEDTNSTGSIVKYIWKISTQNHSDTTKYPYVTYSLPSGGTMTVYVDVYDDDNEHSSDTFNILFNKAPKKPTLFLNTKWLTYNTLIEAGSLQCILSATDEDNPDTISFQLKISKDSVFWKDVYLGTDTTVTLDTLNPSTYYYWWLKATDLYGDSSISTGSFLTPIYAEKMGGMKLIPSNNVTFKMGSDNFDTTEQPIHNVTFRHDFYIDSTEITQSVYDSMMTLHYGSDYTKIDWEEVENDKYPAYYISWNNAILFCNARSAVEGKDTVYSYSDYTGIIGNQVSISGLSIDYSVEGYRLPTEAEWEFACKSGTTGDYLWENNGSIDIFAWYSDNSDGHVHKVATKLPNNYGIYDMNGNVFEWCGDVAGSYPSGDVEDYTGLSSGSNRILRGNSWYSSNDNNTISSTKRYYTSPLTAIETYGFRTVIPILN